MSDCTQEFIAYEDHAELGEIRHEEHARGGLSFEVILSEPAAADSMTSLNRRQSLPMKPVSAEIIEQKLAAAAIRRRSLELKRVNELSEQLARVDQALRKKDSINAIFSNQTKEQLYTKLEHSEEKRSAMLSDMKHRLKSHGKWVEKARELREVEISFEKITIEEKLNNAKQLREEKKQKMLSRLQMRNKIAEIKKRNAQENAKQKLYMAENITMSPSMGEPEI